MAVAIITKVFVATLIVAALCLGTAVADEVPAAAKGIRAVAAVFAFAYIGHGNGVNIDINATAEPPWTEARITRNKDDVLLWRNKDEPCRFDLGLTHIGKDANDITMGEHVASIRFNKLSGETETTFRDGYYRLDVLGLPGAVCDNDSRRGKYTCSDRLSGLFMPHELSGMLRALRFVFANVCSPAELPF